MNVDSILISDYAAAHAGKLTIVGVFNRVPATEMPARLAHMSVSLVIHAHVSEAGTDHTLELRLINGRRENVKDPITAEFQLPPAEEVRPGLPLRHVMVFGILMPQFNEIGPYAFEAYIDGTYVSGAVFYVGA